MNLIVLCAALFVAFLWGLSPVIHKALLTKIDPIVIIVVGGAFYFSMVIGFALWNWKKVRESSVALTSTQLWMLALSSIVAGFGANLIYLYALRQEKSHIISALIYSSPAFSLIFAYLFLKETITLASFTGVILIVAGVVLLSISLSHETAPPLTEEFS